MWRVEHLEVVDSTNSYLRELADAGATEGHVVVADFQSAGRGRRERTWEAPARTSLLCSILLRPARGGTDRQWALSAVALSVRAALVRLCGLRVELKWPNDLVVGGRKLAGILAESATGDGVVVGLGVNLTYDGPEDGSGTSVRTEAGVTIEPEALLDILLEELESRRALLDSAEGLATLRDAYRSALDTLGRRVRVDQATGTVEGTARDVDDDGRLVIDNGRGGVTIAAGDVVHLRFAAEGGP